MNRYKFSEANHIHQIKVGEEWKPLKGTTTVIGEVLPPPLAYYGSGQACKALGWYDRKPRANYLPDSEGMPILEKALEEIKELNPLEYLARLDKAYGAHNEFKKKRGKEGTSVHDKIEKIVKEAIATNEGILLEDYADDMLNEFAAWGKGKKFLASEVHVYSEKLWLGGIVDILYQDNGMFLCDIKTAKGFYPSQFIQNGMYDYQQSENGFFTAEGKLISKPVKIKGYSIIKINKGLQEKIYYNTERLREFAVNIAQMHETLGKLKEAVK